MPRRFQFRVSTLLLITAVVAVLLGWWSHTARRQRYAVGHLYQAHAAVQYDLNTQWYASSGWRSWLVRRLGLDYFGNVVCIKMPRTSTDADLLWLRHIKKLRMLLLSRTQVTDAGLEHLHDLATLQRLDLQDTHVTNAGIQRLQKALPNCKINR